MGFKIKIAYNTIVQIIGKIISSLQTLLITFLIAKVFGVSGYGDFTKITSYIPLFYMISDFGLNAVYIRQADNDENNHYFSNLFSLRFFLSLILMFLAISFLTFLPYSAKTNQGYNQLVKLGIIIASSEILLKGIITSANAAFQKKLQYDRSVMALAIGSLITLFLVFVLVQNPLLINNFGSSGIILVILAYLIGDIITSLLSLFFTRKAIGRFNFCFDLIIWRKLFLASLPLAIILIFNLIYFRIDTFILTVSRSTEEVGLYGLAYRFFEALLVIPTFFMNSLYPSLVKRVKDKIGFKRMIKKSLFILLTLSLLLTGLTFYFSPILIKTVGGENFSESIIALRILSLGLPFFFLSALFMWVLISLNKQKQLAIFYGLSMILNIILNLLFIPVYGILAASVITGLTEAFVLLLTLITSLKILNAREELSLGYKH